ncbi:hypothetical protein TKV_c21340 [Thermoanaerobacter kivui]|uniref:VWFA domain-containing protein n=1 Tax=Thermoanaerobacter kivui TaxID=2325 RepID=A0A097ATW9_THEKI|nr:vWA domain-containing protein [Thermoanaerobacter kivui]AIS53267.1 hypothetical protein TKV_c21340 [Thermoanaerobacter kivui]
MSRILKQITVVTDGKSNIDENSAEAVKEAREKGIIVNAIGILPEENSLCAQQIIEIAKNGEGTYDIVPIEFLRKSLMMVTQKSVQMTLHKAVNSELKNILGKSLEEINPNVRVQIVDYIERLTDNIDLKIAILMDANNIMKNRLDKSKISVVKLFKPLKGRKGKTDIHLISLNPSIAFAIRKAISFLESEYSKAE